MREVGTKEPNVMRSHLAVSLTPTSCLTKTKQKEKIELRSCSIDLAARSLKQLKLTCNLDQLQANNSDEIHTQATAGI
jgi:hypothetical protein